MNKFLQKENEEVEETRSIPWQITHFFKDLFNIRQGLDWIGTVTSIRKKVTLKGENMWMLICSTMIASVGLNLNSGAVIIGAMLISPLMSPILGIGLGIGINDRGLLIKAFKNFAIATTFAILTSVLYFKFLTPFKEPGSEIISRTSPTILDAIVAIFGGIAGIVASSRKDKGAAIPGVAIATALLPPLAVAGFGLAYGIWDYFIKAFYLFFLNSMLIALATFLVVRYLQFPLKQHQTQDAKRKATWAILSFVVILLIPGVIILSGLVKENRRQATVNQFLNKQFNEKGNQVFGSILENELGDTLIYSISYRGSEFDSIEIATFEEQLSKINKRPSEIDPTLLNLSRTQLAKLDNKTSQFDQQLQEKTQKETVYQQQIKELQTKVDQLSIPSKKYDEIKDEILSLWPEIESFSFGKTQKTTRKSDENDESYTIIIQWISSISEKDKAEKQAQLNRYLQANFETNYILLER